MVRVAVADPLPLVRAGVAAALATGGHTVDTPADVRSWASGGEFRILILTLETDRDWALLAEIGGKEGTVAVVALVIDDPTAAGARAMRAGAYSVLPRDTRAESLRRAVEAAADGMATMPGAVARRLRTGASDPGPVEPVLSSSQLGWLYELAAGATVSELAARAGYSERAMYRLLRGVYSRLGAANRTQALMRAQSLGWLTVG